MGADALGIDVLGDERPPTVTGGMTFFGGPGNNYVTHSLATMARACASDPVRTGLVTGPRVVRLDARVGHVLDDAARRPASRVEDVQGAVDAVPLRAVDRAYEGEAVVESYTVGTTARRARRASSPRCRRRAARGGSSRVDDAALAASRSRPPTRSTPRSRCEAAVVSLR